MLLKTIFAGFGGQGVLFMGYSLAHAAMIEGYYVTYLPSYGVEVRGGTANCTVCISDEEIASPIASEPNYLVVMNKPSLLTFQNRVASGGEIFLNSSIIDTLPSRKDVIIHTIPAVLLAEKVGHTQTQNIVMMGAFIRSTGILTADSYIKGLKQIFGKRKKTAFELNIQAFNTGFEFQ
ncbi:MAG: 2-oxoacid:acceptor oxidoreductase family protein [Syntrophales bacterium]|nr:2-oxoacid:acceptor oxidoreductase family protein [Syntrophales bacterium]